MDFSADLQRIFGEFSRLTGQGMSLDEALRRSCDGADRATAEKFARDCRATIAGEVKKLSAMIRTAGGNLREAVDRQRLPRYIREAVLQDLGLPIEESRATGDPLTAYIEKGIALIPEKDKQPIIAYSQHPEQLITDLSGLYAWKRKGVTEYGFVPGRHNLFVIDLDTGEGHANKENGIENFKALIAGAELSNKLRTFFSSFPVNFPCYTQTPSGGLHIYFKADYITQEIAGRFNRNPLKNKNIELKLNEKVTAAGTVRNGRAYVMHGSLESAPRITLDLLASLTLPRPKPIKRYYRSVEGQGSRTRWNQTLEGIEAKAREKAPPSKGNRHNFINQFCLYAEKANADRDNPTSYTQSEIESYLLSIPEVAEHDRSDTLDCISSHKY